MTDALQWGLQAEYRDAAGRRVEAPAHTVDAALAALQPPGGDPQPPGALIVHPGDVLEHPLDVVTEDGRTIHVESVVDDSVPLGYHTCDAPGGERQLIVSPRRCHLPDGLRQGGWAVQLYAARSEQSWGIGDLADLRTLGRWAASGGAEFALVSPINAAAMVTPIEPSPYLPTSRRWRNPLYLRVEDVPGCVDALGGDLDAIVTAGRALNADRQIDRDAVAALKIDALARVAAARPPGADFDAWRMAQGEQLERYATFCAIADDHGGDFRKWPAELRDADGAGVRAARHRAAHRVRFHAWLQWLLEHQLASAASALPLMTDLPIGVTPGGADVWTDRDLFAADFTVGAPPDLFNTLGQDWGQPPWHPQRLRARGYAPLVAVLRAGFAHAMGLRIDHVMGLFRLFWIPGGARPHDGVFIRYPAADMLDILALESARAAAVVVGEDLGTVEPAVRAEMAARDMLSYRLLWFEETEPSGFPRRALSAVTTHDLPTVAGAWTGRDSEIRRSIGMPVYDAGDARMRERLAGVAGGSTGDVGEVVVAAYSALGASPSMLVAAALEDAAQVVEPPNIPGTTAPLWPNWSLALPAPLGEVLASPLAGRVAAALRRS